MTEDKKKTEGASCDTGCKKRAPFAIVAVIIIALVAGGYFTSKSTDKEESTTTEISSSESAVSGEEAVALDVVIATVDDVEIKVSDAKGFIDGIPQLRGQPFDAVFPLVQEQLISSKVVSALATKSDIENDPEVARRMALAKTEIISTVFVEKELEKNVTEAKLQEAYKEFVSKQPAIEEARARHILVEKEADAKALVKKLNDGADFAELAKEKSTGPTGANGGDLGYFTAKDMVGEFSTVAFALNVGEYTKTPVKTQFGYHVIKLEDKRMRPAPSFDEVKPFLESQERKTVLNNLLKTWKADADIEIFDINGNSIEPAAGE